VGDDFLRLGEVFDIENAQATLIVQKSTAQEELSGLKKTKLRSQVEAPPPRFESRGRALGPTGLEGEY
jgi:hypothetical protein